VLCLVVLNKLECTILFGKTVLSFSIQKFINIFGSSAHQHGDFRVELSADGSGRYVEVVALDTSSGAQSVSIGQAGADGSTTVISGGVAQNLFSGTTPTNGFEICNPDASEDLWVSDSTTAAANNTGSYRVAANGGTYTTPNGYKPIGAVSIIGATTGHKITARRW
jgi:hypothetical protein